MKKINIYRQLNIFKSSLFGAIKVFQFNEYFVSLSWVVHSVGCRESRKEMLAAQCGGGGSGGKGNVLEKEEPPTTCCELHSPRESSLGRQQRERTLFARKNHIKACKRTPDQRSDKKKLRKHEIA